MPKQVRHTNYRVVVTPRYVEGSYENISAEDQFTACQYILADIERHVDDILETEIVHDIIETCEFCGSTWTEDGDYNQCCWQDEQYHDNKDILQ